MKTHVIMGRDDSYNMSATDTIHCYHEARLENDVVVCEMLWYDGKPVPNAPSLLIGKTAQQLRDLGFQTWSMGGETDWQSDATLMKLRAALRLARVVTELAPFLTRSEYLHLRDLIRRYEGNLQIDFTQYPVSHLSFLFH